MIPVRALFSCTDYIPFVSTVSSFTRLFLKTIHSHDEIQSYARGSHFYRNLHERSVPRDLVLLIPVIGNIASMIFDLIQWRRIFCEIKNHQKGDEISDTLKKSWSGMLKLAEKDQDALQEADPELLKNSFFFKVACDRFGPQAFPSIASVHFTDSNSDSEND